MDPLDAIRRQIEQAALLPVAEPYTRSSDPLDRLRRHLRGDAANDDQPLAAPTSGLEELIGREVLALMSKQPLPAAARAEAVRRLVIALQDPTTTHVRAVLSVIITGRADG